MSETGAGPELALQIGERQYALETGRAYLLGSAEGCDLRLRHPSVSPRHARLRVRGGQVLLEDAGSTAGTYAGGRRLERVFLHPGASALLGEVPVRVTADLRLAEIVPDPAMVAARAGARVGERAEPGAPPTARRRRSVAGLPLRRSDEATFVDLMADELRLAPWLAISLALHAGALLLLYVLLQPPPAGGEPSPQVGLASVWDREPVERRPAGDLREPVTVEGADLDAPLVDEELDRDELHEEIAEPRDAALLDGPRLLLGNPRIAPRPSGGGSSGGDILAAGGAGLDTGGFVEQVSELRESGLEIVFVFDSTGSMSRVIGTTKRRIHRTLDVLQALVPDARVGIVTYRDRGDDEYVTRSVPLGPDFYRAINFMQLVEAGGGGDPPEAVLDGLEEAFRQQWRKGARRLVVLVGDAPPQPKTQDRILSRVRGFRRGGTSHVHTVVAGAGRRDVQRAAEEAFREIAAHGHGACVRFEDEEELLQRLLTLAFGEAFEANLAEVDRLVRARREKTSTRALDLARSGGAALLRELRRAPVPPEVVQALIQMPRRRAALDLVAALGDADFPESGRQAAAHALQQMLALDRPPLDAERGGPVAEQQLRVLQAMARSKLRE